MLDEEGHSHEKVGLHKGPISNGNGGETPAKPACLVLRLCVRMSSEMKTFLPSSSQGIRMGTCRIKVSRPTSQEEQLGAWPTSRRGEGKVKGIILLLLFPQMP